MFQLLNEPPLLPPGIPPFLPSGIPPPLPSGIPPLLPSGIPPFFPPGIPPFFPSGILGSGSTSRQLQLEEHDITQNTLAPSSGPIRSGDDRTISSHSQSARSSQMGKRPPYRTKKIKNQEKTFTEAVWASAKLTFLFGMWREGIFFLDADPTNNMADENSFFDRCAAESYQNAVSKYKNESGPEYTAIAARIQLHPQDPSDLNKCKAEVRGYLKCHSLCRN